MEWFKMRMDERKNPQLNILSDSEFRVWFRLLCFAAEQIERGTIVFSNYFKLAVEVAAGDEELLSATMHKLTKMGIIAVNAVNEDTIVFVDFVTQQANQYKKPSDSPEKTRERKQRSRLGAVSETLSHADVTPESRLSHADVTPESHTHIDIDNRSQITDQRLRDKDKEIPLPAVADQGCVSTDGAQSILTTGNAQMRPAEKSEYTPEFEEFWQEYPRKHEKKAAFAKWRTKMRAKVSPDVLIGAARGYRAYCESQQTEERYMMHATTFLGPQDRYEEYVGYSPPANASKRTGQASQQRDERYNAFYELFPDA